MRALCAAFEPTTGDICQAFRVPLPAPAGQAARVLSIDLVRLDARRLMAVIGDATHESEREQRDVARQLRHAARIDVLTRMPNRIALIEQIQTVIDREPVDAGYEFAVLFINCDRFKEINDTFGHQVGDEVLALLGGRIRAELRPGDCVGRALDTDQMAARINGDEFVVLLEYLCHPADVHVVAKRLLATLAKPYLIADRPIYCNVSIGVATRVHVTGDADRLLQDASIAMSEAKLDGGARYAVFDRRDARARHASRRDRIRPAGRAFDRSAVTSSISPSCGSWAVHDIDASRRRRGAGAVAASGPRRDPADRIHRDRRTDRA